MTKINASDAMLKVIEDCWINFCLSQISLVGALYFI